MPVQIPFHRPHITEDEIKEVVKTLQSGWITMGPKTVEFEERFKEYIFGDKEGFAISVNSATAGLHLALKAIGLKAGEEVIVPANTFIATAEVVTYFGAVPVLCDIEAQTGNMDVSKIEDLITERTRVIIPVHFGGQPCDMDKILRIARKYNLRVVEDAAHAIPSTYRGQKIGTIGDITCFSFYATKTLTTGEGGMITTRNKEYAEKMKINRLHGISKDAWKRYTMHGSWYYEVVDNGFKYNTTDINSALGIVQLRKIDWMREKRAEVARQYTEAFQPVSHIKTPVIKPERETSWHLYVIQVNNRDTLVEKLLSEGIGTSVHFIPVHKHPFYKKTYGYRDEDFPVANEVFTRSLSLPIYPDLYDEEVEYIIDKVLQYAE